MPFAVQINPHANAAPTVERAPLVAPLPYGAIVIKGKRWPAEAHQDAVNASLVERAFRHPLRIA